MFDSCLSPMLNFIKALHIGWFSDAFNSTAKDNPAVQSNTSKSNTAVRQSNTSIWPVQMPVLNTVRPFSTTTKNELKYQSKFTKKGFWPRPVVDDYCLYTYGTCYLRSPYTLWFHTVPSVYLEMLNSKENQDLFKKGKFHPVTFYLGNHEESFENFQTFSDKILKTLEGDYKYAIIGSVIYSNDESDINSTTTKMVSCQYILPEAIKTGEGLDARTNALKAYHARILENINAQSEYYNYTMQNIVMMSFKLIKLRSIDGISKVRGIMQPDLLLARKLNFEPKPARDTYSLDFPWIPSGYGKKLEHQIVNGNLYVYLNEERTNHVDLTPSSSDSLKHIAFHLTKCNKFIISVQEDETAVDNSVYRIVRYNMSGLINNTWKDEIVNDDKVLIRHHKNFIITYDIKENTMKSYLVRKDLVSLKPKYVKKSQQQMRQVDTRFATLDLETYRDDANISRVYALGFYGEPDVQRLETFYLGDEVGAVNYHGISYDKAYPNMTRSEKLVLLCFEKLTVSKYAFFTVYVHNLSKFDIPFILKPLVESDLFNLETVVRDSHIISVRIAHKYKKDAVITLNDSYNLLSQSLAKLCKTYDTDVTKGVFPYNFVKNNTLDYVGPKPSREFWELNDDNLELYNNIPEEGYDLKAETIKYLGADLISLHKVMRKYLDRVFRDHNFQGVTSKTNSGLAMEIFLRKHHKGQLGLINDRNIYGAIKESYFGGITEVYIPKGSNLYYYDVNSLYPFCALNDMPGRELCYSSTIEENINNLGDIFGFFHCSIECSDLYIGLLTTRNENGICQPMGSWEGWYFSEELKFAAKHGYNITVHRGYHFNRVSNVFDTYVNKLYDVKMNTEDPGIRATTKSLLNNLLGRFALNIENDVTKIVDSEEYMKIIQTRPVTFQKDLGDKTLITYKNIIDSEITRSAGYEFGSALGDKIVNDVSKSRITSLSIGVTAAITAYARIHMNKIKLDVLASGGKCFYTDTDSIITNVPLDHLCGPEIGLFKLEHIIKEGLFLSNKTYYIETEEGKIISRCKGVTTPMSKNQFEELLKGNDVKAIQEYSQLNFEVGYTNIKLKRELNISPSMYIKREKVYENGEWVETKPLTIMSTATPALQPAQPAKLPSGRRNFSYLFGSPNKVIESNPPSKFFLSENIPLSINEVFPDFIDLFEFSDDNMQHIMLDKRFILHPHTPYILYVRVGDINPTMDPIFNNIDAIRKYNVTITGDFNEVRRELAEALVKQIKSEIYTEPKKEDNFDEYELYQPPKPFYFIGVKHLLDVKVMQPLIPHNTIDAVDETNVTSFLETKHNWSVVSMSKLTENFTAEMSIKSVKENMQYTFEYIVVVFVQTNEGLFRYFKQYVLCKDNKNLDLNKDMWEIGHSLNNNNNTRLVVLLRDRTEHPGNFTDEENFPIDEELEELEKLEEEERKAWEVEESEIEDSSGLSELNSKSDKECFEITPGIIEVNEEFGDSYTSIAKKIKTILEIEIPKMLPDIRYVMYLRVGEGNMATGELDATFGLFKYCITLDKGYSDKITEMVDVLSEDLHTRLFDREDYDYLDEEEFIYVARVAPGITYKSSSRPGKCISEMSDFNASSYLDVNPMFELKKMVYLNKEYNFIKGLDDICAIMTPNKEYIVAMLSQDNPNLEVGYKRYVMPDHLSEQGNKEMYGDMLNFMINLQSNNRLEPNRYLTLFAKKEKSNQLQSSSESLLFAMIVLAGLLWLLSFLFGEEDQIVESELVNKSDIDNEIKVKTSHTKEAVQPEVQSDKNNRENYEESSEERLDHDYGGYKPESPQEVEVFHTIQSNLESHYINSILTTNIDSTAKVISPELSEYAERLLSKIDFSSPDWENQLPELPNSPTDSEFSDLVKEIRSGSVVSILSPSPTKESLAETDLSGKDSSDAVETSKLDTKPNIVIITKRVEEGENIPAIPNWINLTHEHNDYFIKRKRLERMIHNDYTNSHGSEVKPSDGGQDWMDKEKDLGLKKLFSDPKDSEDDKYLGIKRMFATPKKKKDTNTMDKEDSYNLDSLFLEKDEKDEE